MFCDIFGEEFHVEKQEKLVARQKVVRDLVLVEYVQFSEGAQEEFKGKANVEILLLQLDILRYGFRIAPANRSGAILDERSICGTFFSIW